MHIEFGYKLKYKQGNNLPCFYYSSADSTNTRAKALIGQGKINDAAVILAGRQFAGRGRYDRSFVSPCGGLYMTYVKRLPQNCDYAYLGCAAAVALIETLTRMGFSSLTRREGFQNKISVKWPNDVRIDGKKVVGILPESVVCGEDRFVIIGIGVNVNTTAKQLGNLIETATSLRIAVNHRFSKRHASVLLAVETDKAVRNCLDGNRAEMFNSYKKYCDTVGKQIFYTNNSGNKECGKAIEIDYDGSLIVDNNGKNEKIGWGEIIEIK